MKVRIPKHREFVIEFQEEGQKQNEGWAELQKILRDYEKQGKSIYTETFIEDNEERESNKIQCRCFDRTALRERIKTRT